MPRVTVIDWLDAVDSKHGPMPPQLRHLCHVLARTMDGDGSGGAYYGSRAIGERMGVHRSTVSRQLAVLATTGWLEVEQRRVQYGRKAFRYFAAIPLALAHLGAPIRSDNGASRRANPGNGADNPGIIGAAQAGIGAQQGEIGAPGCARLLLTPTEKSAASPSPADAGSAAQRNRAKEVDQQDAKRASTVDRLLRGGKTPEEIAAELGQSLDYVLSRQRLRNLNPFRKAQR